MNGPRWRRLRWGGRGDPAGVGLLPIRDPLNNRIDGLVNELINELIND